MRGESTAPNVEVEALVHVCGQAWKWDGFPVELEGLLPPGRRISQLEKESVGFRAGEQPWVREDLGIGQIQGLNAANP
jgi:hypothetical protein